MKRILSFRDGINVGTALIILGALFAFELFNYESTRYGLDVLFGSSVVDLLGFPMSMAGVLAVAACGIDLAGVARVFTPERGKDEPIWVWILTAGWFLSAMINAGLTWWTVLLLVSRAGSLANPLVDPAVLLRAVPVVIAVFVLLTRLSIIGAISIAGEDFFRTGRKSSYRPNVAIRKSPPIQEAFNITMPK